MPQDLAQPPVAVATAFVASDGEAAAFATAAEALAATEALRRAQPDAVIAVHVADRERPGAARARRLRDVGRPGQTLVSAAAAAALPAGAGAVALHDLGLHRLRDLSPPERVFALGGPRRRAAALAGRYAEQPAEPPDDLPWARRGARGAARPARSGPTDHHHRPRRERQDAPGGAARGRRGEPPAGRRLVGGAGRHRRPWPGRRVGGRGAWRARGPRAGDRRTAACTARLAPPAALPGQLRARARRRRRRRRRAVRGLPGGRDRRHQPGAARAHGRAGVAAAAAARRARRTRCSSSARSTCSPTSPSTRRPAPPSTRCACGWTGSPLALELAAAWLRTLTPRQIEAGLDDRFALLVRSPRDAVPRHASLLASMAWSHDLLDEDDRAVFRRLAVFRRASTWRRRARCAAEDADALGALARLVDKSLVVADGARYRLPETIREYAADRLRAAGERRATTDRLSRTCSPACATRRRCATRDKDAWRAALAPEHDNLRAAIEHGLDAEDPEPARALVAELPWLWQMHRQGREGLDFLRRAIARAPTDRSAVQARLLTGVALVADTAGPLDLEFDAAQRAARAGRRARRRAPALALPGAGRRRALLHGLRRGMRAGARGRADRGARERRVRDPRRAGAARDRRPPARRARRRAGAAGRRRRAPGSPRRPRRGRDRSRV